MNMPLIDKRRTHILNNRQRGSGPVVYWMSREQRVQDNWGLLHARGLAGNKHPLMVAFCLVPSFLGATFRQYDFLLRGLAEVEKRLKDYGIPFVLRMGNPVEEIVRFSEEVGAGVVVTDFDPLRIKQAWQRQVGEALPVPLVEVDGHNVVPARLVSDKQEYAARTIRPKVHRHAAEFLTNIPELVSQDVHLEGVDPVDWRAVRDAISVDETVGPVSLVPGETAALKALDHFVNHGLDRYAGSRNDPNADATSGLSPYFHFGHLSPQRAALAANMAGRGENQESFLEELIVRRELSENFCLHNQRYDSLAGAPEWALRTLEEHQDDAREYVYSLELFERAQTHSRLWNAAQAQLLATGHMHGYMRMYWAKKILEWSESPQEAHAIALTLNDRYQLDGRDPNGYVGVLWSLAGLHDRAWKRRPVFGSIRYMNERGCRRKFDVDRYCETWLSDKQASLFPQ